MEMLGRPAGATCPPTITAPKPAQDQSEDHFQTTSVDQGLDSEDTSNTTFAARVATVPHWLEIEPELTGIEIGTRLDVSGG